MTNADLTALLETLRRFGVKRYAAGNVLIVLEPAVERVECEKCHGLFAAAELAAHPCTKPAAELPSPTAEDTTTAEAPSPTCACGHDLVVEHNENGCLLCSGDACGEPSKVTAAS